jgi:hypothetical protein
VIVFSASEPATFACSLDGLDYSQCTSPKSYPGLTIGPHSFRLRATDTAGNVTTSNSYEWTVVPPDTPAGPQEPPAEPGKATKPPKKCKAKKKGKRRKPKKCRRAKKRS